MGEWTLPEPLRFAHRDEAEGLARLLAQLSCWSGGGAAALEPFWGQGHSRLVVLGPRGAPAAAAVVHVVARFGGLRMFVDELVVDEAQRGKGLGKVLLGGLNKVADGWRADMLARVDPAGDGLYRGLGFAPEGDAWLGRSAAEPLRAGGKALA